MHQSMINIGVIAICALCAIIALKAAAAYGRRQYRAKQPFDGAQVIACAVDTAALTYINALSCGYSRRDARSKVRATIAQRYFMLEPEQRANAVQRGIANACN